MKTRYISKAEMQDRVARFRRLEPLPATESLEMAQAAKDLIYSRTLLSVIGLEDATTPINQGAPIRGAGGITMTHAVRPSGTSTTLHAHRETYETFTVLRGRFELYWNDDGKRVELDEFDTPGVCRGFRNISDQDAILQVLISGGVHDMNDIDYPPAVADEVRAYGDNVVEQFEARGITFTAGTAEA
ncbi:MAG: hypothetical protein ACPHUF_16900 [Gammaproteobacteria bacterium]